MSCSSDSDLHTGGRTSRRKQKSPRKTSVSCTTPVSLTTGTLVIPETEVIRPPLEEITELEWQAPRLNHAPNDSFTSELTSGDLSFSEIATDKSDGDVTNEDTGAASGSGMGQYKRSMRPSETTLTCLECERKFTSRHQLEVHKIVGHDMSQKHQCPHCKLFFPLKTVLTRHIKNVHSPTPTGQVQNKWKGQSTSPHRFSFFMDQKMVYLYKKAHGKPVLEGRYIAVEDSLICWCCLCDHEADNVTDMKSHFKSEHTEWGLAIICPMCMCEFARLQKVDYHIKMKRCRQLTAMLCKLCGLSFDKPGDYLEHTQTAHQTRDRRYRCERCDMTFAQLFYLEKHLQSYRHNKQVKPKKHLCTYCRKAFSSSIGLKSHLLKSHFIRQQRDTSTPTIQTSLHGDGAMETSLSYGEEGGDGEGDMLLSPIRDASQHVRRKDSWGCGKCNIEFKSPAEKLKHVNEEHRSWKCEQCGKGFVTRSKLNLHMTRHNDKNLACPLCENGKRYSNESNVRNHVRRVHSERYFEIYGWEIKGRTYDCEVCDKKCSSLGDYKKHMRVHTNERPFVCRHCPSAFKQSRHVKEHMMYKHKEQYESEFGAIQYKHICAECGKKFLAKGSLNKHLRAHARQKLIESCRDKSRNASLDSSQDDMKTTSTSQKSQSARKRVRNRSKTKPNQSIVSEANTAELVLDWKAVGLPEEIKNVLSPNQTVSNDIHAGALKWRTSAITDKGVEVIDVIKIEPRGYSDEESQ